MKSKTHIHDMPSPFPRVVQNIAITDETCTCGRNRSEHLDTLQWGHGGTPDGACVKFTWTGFVAIAITPKGGA